MKLLAFTIAVCLSASLAGLGAAASAQTLKKIADNQKMTVSYRESSVPFSYLIGPNKAVGFAVDLTDAIVEDVRKKLKNPRLEVAYLPVTSQNRIPLLLGGSYDLECGSTTHNTTRGQDVDFAITHFYAGTRLLVKKTSGIKNYADLADKTVASTTGTTNSQVIRKYNTDHHLNLQLLLGRDHDEGLLMVEDDRAVAFAMDDILLVGLRANAENPAELEVVGDLLQVEPYACMLRKDDPEFKKLVNGTLARLMKSGEFTRMYNQWFMSPIPPKGVNLNLPMSAQLKANLKTLSDAPAL